MQLIRIEEELVVNNKTIDARILSRMFLGRSQESGSKKRMDQRTECISGTGWRYRNQYDNDDHVSSCKEVSDLSEIRIMESLAKAISSGSLRGARGNSGVILSQLLRGFTKSVKEKRNWMQ